MEIDKLSVKGSPHIGVYIFVNDQFALVPPGLTSHEKEVLLNTLRINDIVETKIAGSELIGVMVAGNNNGLVLPRNILDEEYEFLRKTLSSYSLNLYISRSKHTAMGNIVLSNTKYAIVGSVLEKQEIPKIKDVLGLEDIIVRDIMYLNIPGSLGVVTDKGGVIHPDISDDELLFLEEYFKVDFERATVNAGIPFIKSGLIANNYGVVVGEKTTGPEILRIRRGLGGE